MPDSYWNHSQIASVHLLFGMRIRVRYAGRVQGVGFRANARSIAAGHPVTGWVRNEPEGTVLLEMQGEEGAVRGALDEIRTSMARYIATEDAATISDVSDETGFQITR